MSNKAPMLPTPAPPATNDTMTTTTTVTTQAITSPRTNGNAPSIDGSSITVTVHGITSPSATTVSIPGVPTVVSVDSTLGVPMVEDHSGASPSSSASTTNTMETLPLQSPPAVAASISTWPRSAGPPAALMGLTAAVVVGEKRVRKPIGHLRARIAELQRQLHNQEHEEKDKGDDLDDDEGDEDREPSDDDSAYIVTSDRQSRRDEVALGRAAHTTGSPNVTPSSTPRTLPQPTPLFVPPSSTFSTSSTNSPAVAVSSASAPPPPAAAAAASAPSSSAFSSSSSGGDSPHGVAGRRLLIVTNRLPVSLVKKKTKESKMGRVASPPEGKEEEWHFTKSSGGLVSALNGVKGIDMTWIGWPGEEIKRPEDQKEISTRLQEEMKCVPVFLPKTMSELYYSGFANGLLWPLFHYMQPAIELIQGADQQFTAYQQANQAFCDIVLQHYQEGDLIWVHDYHLFLLPALLREKLPNARIGYFLHIPFPSSELYQTLPWREQLLQGLLASNLVGFHTHDFARHFFISCTRILGLQCTSEGVETPKGFSAVGTFPIGIDADRFKQALKTDSVREHTKELRQQFGDMRVLLGIDRLDYTKGLPHKLFAMERFLQDNPDWVGKVVFVQIAVPSRGDVPEYQRLSKKVHQLVGRINGKFGSLTHVPIHLLDTSIGFDRMCALYRIADVCVVSSIRDGMNLVSYEFISCQSERQPGVLILSEFTGAAQSLGAGAITVNPWDTNQMANAMLRALTMPEAERREHYRWCYHHVNKHTAQYWADNFVSSLIGVNSTLSDSKTARSIPQSLRPLRVAHAFHGARHRLIVSGLVGTLSHKRLKGMAKDAQGPLFAMANNRTRQIVGELAKDPSTTFLLVTARGRPMCDRIMGRTQAWIAAENGYFLRRGPDAEWETPFDNVDISWIPEVRTIFEYFSQRTPKSFIEERTSYLSWHYHDCDQYFGEKQARELLLNLMSGPLANASMQVFHHARIIQVRPIGVSKAFLVDRLITELESKRGPIDLAICMGNFPPMDEDIFAACQPRQTPTPPGSTPSGKGLSPLLPTRSVSTPYTGGPTGTPVAATTGTMGSSATAATSGTPPATPSMSAASSTSLPASEVPLSGATPPLNPARLQATSSLPPMVPLELAAAGAQLDGKVPLMVQTMMSPAARNGTGSPRQYATASGLFSPASVVPPIVQRTVFTIAVGRKHSRASYYLEGIRAVEKLLESLVDTLPSAATIHSPSSMTPHASAVSAIVRPLALPPPHVVPGVNQHLAGNAAPMTLGSPQPLPSSSVRAGVPSSHATVSSKAIPRSTSTTSVQSGTDDEMQSPQSAAPAIHGSPKSAEVHAATGLRLLQSSMSLPDFPGNKHDTV